MEKRTTKFMRSLGAGYGLTAVQFAYTLTSVPLALHFLPIEQFGLWMVVSQMTGFLQLFDLGMGSSVARLLADFKDRPSSPEYQGVLRAGALTFALLGACVVAGACLFAWFLPAGLKIPSSLVGTFQILVVGMGFIIGIGLGLKIYGSPLWSAQRQDIGSVASSANLLTNLGMLALGFHLGWGLYSFLLASAIGSLWSWLLPWYAARKLGFLPHVMVKAPPMAFARLFAFGRDVFMMQLGSLLCSASPLLLVTRILGLESAAIFSVATKTLILGQQLVGRILESAAPGLTELFVRGERERFVRRFYQILSVSVAAAAALAVGLMFGNRGFVSIWTHGAVQWSGWGDILLALQLVVSVTIRFSTGIFGMAADFSRVRWLAILEGVIFSALILLGGSLVSLEGVLAIVLGAQIAVSLIASTRHLARCFPFPSFWKSCPLQVALVLAGGLLVSRFLSLFVENPWSQLGLAALLSSLAGSVLFWNLRTFPGPEVGQALAVKAGPNPGKRTKT